MPTALSISLSPTSRPGRTWPHGGRVVLEPHRGQGGAVERKQRQLVLLVVRVVHDVPGAVHPAGLSSAESHKSGGVPWFVVVGHDGRGVGARVLDLYPAVRLHWVGLD
jgi:hypothetical protein